MKKDAITIANDIFHYQNKIISAFYFSYFLGSPGGP